MNRDLLKRAVENGQIEWQRHALERMMERGISRAGAKQVLLPAKSSKIIPTISLIRALCSSVGQMGRRFMWWRHLIHKAVIVM